MNLTEELKKAVEKRKYEETARYMQQVCEDVLGYERIAECQPIDAINVRSRFETTVKLPTETPFQTEEVEEFIKIKPVKVQTTLRDICWHYGKSSARNPEGIIVNLWYKEVENNFILGCEEINAPPVMTFGYGDRWLGKGETISVSDCQRMFLKIPQYVFTLDYIDFKRFFDIIKK